jgi:hypothetical protein
MRTVHRDKKNSLVIPALIAVIIILAISTISLLTRTGTSVEPRHANSISDTVKSSQAPQAAPESVQKQAALDELANKYQSCIDEGSQAYTNALNNIPEGTETDARWSYIQSVQQVTDSHKENCDRIYQKEKDKLGIGAE